MNARDLAVSCFWGAWLFLDDPSEKYGSLTSANHTDHDTTSEAIAILLESFEANLSNGHYELLLLPACYAPSTK